jgi:hypothetical protein
VWANPSTADYPINHTHQLTWSKVILKLAAYTPPSKKKNMTATTTRSNDWEDDGGGGGVGEGGEEGDDDLEPKNYLSLAIYKVTMTTTTLLLGDAYC